MKRKICLAALAGLLAAAPHALLAKPFAIVGATLIDVSRFGRSQSDISDAVVVVDDGKVRSVGRFPARRHSR